MIRICFVDDEPEIYPHQYGGKARTIINLASALAEEKNLYEVTIFSRSINIDKDNFRWQGVKFIKLEDKSIIQQIKSISQSYDIVNVHNCSFTFPEIKDSKAVFVYHLHDLLFTTAAAGSHLDKALSRNWDAIVAPSEFAASVFRSYAAITGNASRLVIIPRMITEEFFGKPIRKGTETNLKILVPNRPIYEKGYGLLVSVANILAHKQPGSAILVTDSKGIPPQSTGLKNIGWLDKSSLISAYKDADITLNLSLLPESFSQVCLESISAGTPVVSSGFGNISRLAESLPAIYLPGLVPDDIVKEITRVTSYPQKVSDDISESQLIIRQEYSKKSIIGKFKDLYNSLLSKKVVFKQVKYPNKFYFVSKDVYISKKDKIAYFIDKDRFLHKYLLSTSSQKILNNIKSITTIKDIVESTKMSEINIQHDIDVLLNDGILCCSVYE